MDNKDYDYAIGKLVRLRAWLKPQFHAKIDELIDSLVTEAEGL